jgi:hypothetical protein
MIWGSHEENSKSKLPSSPSPGDATCQICQFHQEKAVTGCDPMAFWRFLFDQRFTTVTATQLLLDMPWGAAAGSSAE